MFRTSDNRIFAKYGHVDPVVWSQLQALGAPDGLQTLLSNNGTLYVRMHEPTPPPAPWPRRRTSSPDAVAGSQLRDSLLERLEPSEVDVPVSVPSVEAMGAPVPEADINIDQLVEKFKGFVSTEGGRDAFGDIMKQWLRGDLNFDPLEVSEGKEKKKEGEGDEKAKTVAEMIAAALERLKEQ